MRRIFLKRSIIAIAFLSMILAGCGGKKGSDAIDLQMAIQPETLSDALYIKMNYQFKLKESFDRLGEGHVVFVHFWKMKNKEMLLQDDHTPQKPFDQWKASDEITYSRTLFIPKFINEFDVEFDGYEEVKLTIGIYDPKVKNSEMILLERVLNVQAEGLTAPEIVYDKGWHQPETDLNIQNKAERSWRWTSKSAVCIIENRKTKSLLEIRGGVDQGKIENQTVIIKINDQILDQFIPESAKFFKRYVISPDQMGNDVELTLTVETDKTFIPSELHPDVKDNRELGVQVYSIYFREYIQ